MLDEYFDLRGWDRERGWPVAETLKRLGIPEVAERLGVAGG